MINYMPEISDIITTDYDHHVAGTAAIAADKASYTASQVISNFYNTLKEALKDKQNVQVDLDRLDDELRIYRRGYLSLVRDIATWMSTAHMIAIPPYRRILGTRVKRTAILALAGILETEKHKKEYEELIEAMAEFLWELAETIHKPYQIYRQIYKDLKSPKKRNKLYPLALTLPGGILPDDDTLDIITDYLEKLADPKEILSDLLQEPMPVNNKDEFINTVKETFLNDEFEPIKIRRKLAIATFITKYKIKGAILGLAITTQKILEELYSLHSENQLYKQNISNKNKTIELLSYLMKAYEAFIASISIPIIPIIPYKIKNNKPILYHDEKSEYKISKIFDTLTDVTKNIPCCILDITTFNNIKLKSLELNKILIGIILSELMQNLPSHNSKYIKKYNNLIKLFNYIHINVEIHPIYLYNKEFSHIESEAVPSAFIQDILNKLYEDIWVGSHTSMIDIQEPILIINEKTRTIFDTYSKYSIELINSILTNISNITEQHNKYYNLYNLYNKYILNNNYNKYSLIYYKSLLIVLINLYNNLNKYKDKYKNIEYIYKLYNKIILLLEKYKIFINKLYNYLEKIINKENNYLPITVSLELLNDYTFNKFINNKLIKYNNIKNKYKKILINSTHIVTPFLYKYYKNIDYTTLLNTINTINNYILILFTIFEPIDQKYSIEKYISNKIKQQLNNKLSNNTNINIDVKFYIPIKGIIKPFYHYTSRPIYFLSIPTYSRILNPVSPFTIIVLYNVSSDKHINTDYIERIIINTIIDTLIDLINDLFYREDIE